MHQIEQALTKNSWTGAGVSILSSVLAKTSLLADPVVKMTFRENMISWASDIGILVGLLIGCLTLVLKAKEFYKEFIINAAKKRAGDKSTPTASDKDVPGDSSESVG